MNEECLSFVLCLLLCTGLSVHASRSFQSLGWKSPTSFSSAPLSHSGVPKKQLLQSDSAQCFAGNENGWNACAYMGCGVNIESDMLDALTSTSCVYDETTMAWDCGEVFVDSATYQIVRNGTCTRSCKPMAFDCEIHPQLKTSNNVQISSSACPDGSVATEFNCDCKKVSRTQMLAFTHGSDGESGGCNAICDETDRDLSTCVTAPNPSKANRRRNRCPTMICLYQGCAAQIAASAVTVIQRSSCTFSTTSKLWTCGDTLDIDEPGYQWTKFGSCVEACTIEFRSDICLFEARYGRLPEPDVEPDVDKEDEKKNNRKRKKRNRTKAKKDVDEGPKEPSKKTRSGNKEKRSIKDPGLAAKAERKKSKTTEKAKRKGKVRKERKRRGNEDKDKSFNTTIIDESSDRSYLEGVYDEQDGGNVDTYYTAEYTDVDDDVEADGSLPEIGNRLEQDTFIQSAVIAVHTESSASVINETATTANETEEEAGTRTDTVVRPVAISLVSENTARPPPPPPPPPPEESSSDVRTYSSPWMLCRQSCETTASRVNDRERFVVCQSKSTGLPVARNLCPSIAEQDSIEACPVKEEDVSCNGTFVYEFQDWTQCSLKNGKCVRTRDYECFEKLEDGSLFPTSKKNCSDATRKFRQLDCDPRQCTPVIYLPSEWGICNCDQSEQHRNVTCISSLEPDQELDATVCESVGLFHPQTVRPCTCDDSFRHGRLLLQRNDNCEGKNCSGNGKCRNGICECHPAFMGENCDIQKNVTFKNDESCPKNMSINGECCKSGIYDMDFDCCSPDSTLDRNGHCCSGTLDACGVCNGTAKYVDVFGECCETTLDANGLCCKSGNIDDCGVCDGFGMTCNFRLSFGVTSTPTSNAEISNLCVEDLIGRTVTVKEDVEDRVMYKVLQREELEVLVPGSLVAYDHSIAAITRTLTERLIRLNRTADACPGLTFDLTAVDRAASSRNGFCEIGETVFLSSASFSGVFSSEVDLSGLDDCFFVIATCPTSLSRANNSVGEVTKACSGKGICNAAGTAFCSCFNGYGGEACDQCLDGYTPLNGHCVPIPPPLPLPLPLPSVVNNPNNTEGQPVIPIIQNGTNPKGTSPSPAESQTQGGRDQRQFTVVVASVLGVLGVIIIVALMSALWLSFTDYNGFAQHIPSTVRTASTTRSEDAGRASFSGASTDVLISGSVKTTSSGTPIVCTTEPEEVTATPNRKVSELMDGSDFHGNTMHRPCLPSSSSQPNNAFRALTLSTIDISGERRQSRRMPSADDSPLMPIQEGSSINFESRDSSSFGAGTSTGTHTHKSSKSLDRSPFLQSFNQWLDPSEAEEQRNSASFDFTNEEGRASPMSSSRSAARSDATFRVHGNKDSISSFEFDLQSSMTGHGQTPTTDPESPENPRADISSQEQRSSFATRWWHFFRFRTETDAPEERFEQYERSSSEDNHSRSSGHDSPLPR